MYSRHDYTVTTETNEIGPMMLCVQATRDSPYRGLFMVHAWIGVTPVGSWPMDTTVAPSGRPRIAREIHDSLVLTDVPAIRQCVARVMDAIDSWTDDRPERIPSTLEQIADALRGQTGTVYAHSIHAYVTGVTHPGRSIAKLMANESNRVAIARRIGVSRIEYVTGRQAGQSGPIVKITP